MQKATQDLSQEQEKQNVRLEEVLSGIKEKYIVMSGKGGVGKSTIAVNLAVFLSNRNFKVGLMDIDLHGPNTLQMLGLEGMQIGSDGNALIPLEYNENLKVISISSMLQSSDTPVIWRGPMKIGAIKQFIADVAWGELDYLIIDSPPGTGDEPLTVAQDFPGSKSIIVTTPQAVSILDVRKSITFCKHVSMPILGLIENMSGFICPYCGKCTELFGSGRGKEAAADMDVRYLGAIPLDPGISDAGDSGNPYIVSQPKSDIAESFRQIVDSLLEENNIQGGKI